MSAMEVDTEGAQEEKREAAAGAGAAEKRESERNVRVHPVSQASLQSASHPATQPPTHCIRPAGLTDRPAGWPAG